MAHGVFGKCASKGKWVKVGRKREGMQQYKCSNCGKLKSKKVTSWGCALFGTHKYGARMRGRKHAPKVLKCQLCGKTKPVGGK